MTVSEVGRQAPAGLLLVAVGPSREVAERTQAVAARLAALTTLPVRTPDAAAAPHKALADLGEGRSTLAAPAWLAPLAVDPGQALGSEGHWAEGLGAWRQPTLLILAADQLSSGWPAAATALLRLEGVPLVGLLQWGGEWQPDARRLDSLPWLGALTASPADGDQEVLAALAQRWHGLDLV